MQNNPLRCTPKTLIPQVPERKSPEPDETEEALQQRLNHPPRTIKTRPASSDTSNVTHLTALASLSVTAAPTQASSIDDDEWTGGRSLKDEWEKREKQPFDRYDITKLYA